VVGDGGACDGRGRVRSIGDTFNDNGDKCVDEELADADTEVVDLEAVRRDRKEVRLGSCVRLIDDWERSGEPDTGRGGTSSRRLSADAWTV